MTTPLNNDTERGFLVRPLTSLAQNVCEGLIGKLAV